MFLIGQKEEKDNGTEEDEDGDDDDYYYYEEEGSFGPETPAIKELLAGHNLAGMGVLTAAT